jgi:large subunit ribosomal protein L3
MLGLLGEKLGMTQVYGDDGALHTVTVVKAGPCTITQVKKKDEKDGYDAIQLGFGTPKSKRVNKPCRGKFEKSGVKLCSQLKEFRTDNAGEFTLGQKLTVEAFKPGDVVDVAGVTKGRGFQGVMKRHGKHGGPASHGSSVHRRPGSIGMCAWPGRVFKNMGMPGHMGVENVTIKNLKIFDVKPDDNLLYIEGAIPGSRGGMVTVFNRAEDFESREELKPTQETPEQEPAEQEPADEKKEEEKE